jgi:hypothetical protein
MSPNEPSLALPFSLAPDDLPHVEVMYGLYSSKSGAGVEEVFLHGAGRVVLRRTAAYNAPPEIREGALPVSTVVRLLEIMADQRFDGLDDAYPSDHPGLRRIVRLRSPKVSKQVAVDNEGNAQFERVVSALLFAASLAEPEVLQRRFFTLMGPI